MENIAVSLRWVAANVLYPIIVVGTFLFLSIYVSLIVIAGYKKDYSIKTKRRGLNKKMVKPASREFNEPNVPSREELQGKLLKLEDYRNIFPRLLTAAILPLITLVFVTTLVQADDHSIKEIFTSIGNGWGLLIGGALGFLICTIGHYLKKEGLSPVLFTLFLSFVVVFILFSVMLGYLSSLNYFLWGVVSGGGAFIMFIGTPSFDL